MVGIFSNQKYQIGYIFYGLGIDNVQVCILWPFGIFYNHLKCFMAIRYILRSFGNFLPILVCCAKKNLATLQFKLIPVIFSLLLSRVTRLGEFSPTGRLFIWAVFFVNLRHTSNFRDTFFHGKNYTYKN
jgi:hypothetical protein